jgi:hypothetical protein
MAMISSAPPSLQFSHGPSESKTAGPSFGKAPPLGISRPSSFGTGSLKRASSTSGVKQEWSSEVTVQQPAWNVDELEQVPIDFPLERTHREIYGVDAKEVASRIQNSLKKLSIQAEYDGSKAKAKCTTCDMVSFRIRLFAGGENGLPVVVEVQRRNGSMASFMRSCKAILDGAEGKEVCVETTSSAKKLPPFIKGPIGGMKCLESVYNKSDPVVDMKSDLERATEMLKSNTRDTNVLGLENLSQMTDALKTRPDIALMVSQKILLAEECDLREDIAVAVQRDVFSPEDDGYSANSLTDQARHLALMIFSNSLALLSKKGTLDDAVRSQKWFTSFLIPTLVDEVRSCQASANNSYEAACGLCCLASSSEAARRAMHDIGATDDLLAAQKFGKDHHELLMNETERCLRALGVVASA